MWRVMKPDVIVYLLPKVIIIKPIARSLLAASLGSFGNFLPNLIGAVKMNIFVKPAPIGFRNKFLTFLKHHIIS